MIRSPSYLVNAPPGTKFAVLDEGSTSQFVLIGIQEPLFAGSDGTIEVATNKGALCLHKEDLIVTAS